MAFSKESLHCCVDRGSTVWPQALVEIMLAQKHEGWNSNANETSQNSKFSVMSLTHTTIADMLLLTLPLYSCREAEQYLQSLQLISFLEDDTIEASFALILAGLSLFQRPASLCDLQLCLL